MPFPRVAAPVWIPTDSTPGGPISPYPLNTWYFQFCFVFYNSPSKWSLIVVLAVAIFSPWVLEWFVIKQRLTDTEIFA